MCLSSLEEILKESIFDTSCALGPVQTREEQLQEKRVEKMMRAAAKDVHKIRGQSRKEVPEIQTFRWEKQHTRFQSELDRVLIYETQLVVSR